MVEDDFFVVLFNTFHHLLQQWAEAEEKDCCCTSHDGEEREEVGEIRDLESEEGVHGLFCCGEQGCQFSCKDVTGCVAHEPHTHQE